MKKATPKEGSHQAERTNNTTLRPSCRPGINTRDTKKQRLLRRLLAGPIDRFAAEGIGDHTLNSSISTLRNRHGLLIEGKPVKIGTKWGKCWVKVYRLPPSEHAKARALLKQLSARHRAHENAQS